MTGAMYAAIAGLKTHMTKLSVIGNNVANVNTVGYKNQRTLFKDSMYSMYSSGSNGTTTAGGKNPSQTGFGSQISSIDLNMGTGSYTPGNGLDCMIYGEGFFLAGDKLMAEKVDPLDPASLKNLDLTRVGDFRFGPDGYLVDGSGSVIYGFMNTGVDIATGEISVCDQLVPIRLPKLESRVENQVVGYLETMSPADYAGLNAIQKEKYQPHTYVSSIDSTKYNALPVAEQEGYEAFYTSRVPLSTATTYTGKDGFSVANYLIDDATNTALLAENIDVTAYGFTDDGTGNFTGTLNCALYDAVNAIPALATIATTLGGVEVTSVIDENAYNALGTGAEQTSYGTVIYTKTFEAAEYNAIANKADYGFDGSDNDIATYARTERITIAEYEGLKTEGKDVSAYVEVREDVLLKEVKYAEVPMGEALRDYALDDPTIPYVQMSSVTIDAKTGAITGTTKDTEELITVGYLAIGNVTNPNGVTHKDGFYYSCGDGAGELSVTMLGGVNEDLGINYVNGSLYGKRAEQEGLDPDVAKQSDKMLIGSAGGVNLMTGGLEGSNVDLATEISEMITTQRGYQANTRIITVTDSMLEELVNMKR